MCMYGRKMQNIKCFIGKKITDTSYVDVSFFSFFQDKLPEFRCSLCTRSFHCRSGLVWHLKNTHKVFIGPGLVPDPGTSAHSLVNW